MPTCKVGAKLHTMSENNMKPVPLPKDKQPVEVGNMHPHVKRSGNRARSNSRSAGSKYQIDLDQFAIPNNVNETSAVVARQGSNSSALSNQENSVITDSSLSMSNNIPQSLLTSRNKYTHIIVLKSLNGTFETKFLMIPFKPDILKLGRPVVNNNSANNSSSNSNVNNNNVGNLKKKTTSALVRPDNGNFDSRVLSRNHACLSCDSTTGKIYIKDLKSSNGTFVNNNRIDQNEVELKVGDVINLGTDIDTKFEHRKISALVEDIAVIPLINNIMNSTTTTTNKLNTGSMNDSLTSTSLSSLKSISNIPPLSPQKAAFDAAMFGDINNLGLEDNILGNDTEVLSGIFINNSIGTNPNLTSIIKMLSTQLALEKQEFAKLQSVENFLVNYTTNLEYINKLMIEMNDKQLVKLQSTLKQTFINKQEEIVEKTKQQIFEINDEKESIKDQFILESNKKNEKITKLEMEIEDLKTRLEVERYKNAQVLKKKNIEQISKKSSPSPIPVPNPIPLSTSVPVSALTPSESILSDSSEIKNSSIESSANDIIVSDTGETKQIETIIDNVRMDEKVDIDSTKHKNRENSNTNGNNSHNNVRVITLTAISFGLFACLFKLASK